MDPGVGPGGRHLSNGKEKRAFDDLYNQGILFVAAAGNDGTTDYSYPASYDAVISVAAVDSTGTVADFSQKNDQVELAAPGAALIYNNEPGNFYGTLGDGNSSNIIALSLSQEDGQYLVANKLGFTADVTSSLTKPASGYEAWSGAVVLCERGTAWRPWCGALTPA